MKRLAALMVIAGIAGLSGAGCLGLFSSSRLATKELWNRPFARDTVLPTVSDAKARRALDGCLRQLNFQFIEFEDFMRLVGNGTIPVAENPKGGLWQSRLAKGGYVYLATYPGKRAPVRQFEKRIDQDPYLLMWSFVLHPNGRLQAVETLDWGLRFDEAGKLHSFWYTTVAGEHFLVVEAAGGVKTDFFPHPYKVTPAAKLVRNLQPTGWEMAVTPDPAQCRPLSGLKNPLGEILLTQPGRSLTWKPAPDREETFHPSVVLLVFPRAEAETIAAAVAKPAAGPQHPVVFGWNRDFVFVTAPGYLNAGIRTEGAQTAVRELKAALGIGITIPDDTADSK